MRSEWKEVKLKDIVSFNPTERLQRGCMAKKVAMADIAERQRKIPTYDIAKYTSGAKFRNGDTLFARITPCLENGKIAQVDILDDGEIGFGSTEFIVWREKQGLSHNDFLFYLANYPPVKDTAIKSMIGTSGRQRVQIDVLKEYELLAPPLPTQEAIAATLSCLDAKIEVNNKINENLEQQAQAIFKSWFVDFEPFQDGEFVESGLGLIPKGWEVQSLSEISVEIITGKTPKTRDKKNYGDYMMFITIPDMHGNTFITQTERYLSRAGVATQPKKTLPPNSIVVSCIATAGLVSLTSDYSHTNQQINAIIPKKSVSPYFIYLYMKTLSTYINDLGAGGTATVNLNKGQFSKIKLLLPSKLTMERFHVLVGPLFEAIKQNQYQNSTLAALRDTLLPKLMSGEIVVPIADQ